MTFELRKCSLRKTLLALLIASLSLLSACEASDPNGLWGQSRLLANESGAGPADGRSRLQRFKAALSGRNPERRSLGTDRFLGFNGNSDRDLVEVSDSGDITLNLIGVPIEQAAKAVLGDALKKNYTIQSGLSGEITLQTTRPLSERALLDTFQTVLELNGATLQPSNGLIKIVASAGAVRRIGRAEDPSATGARIVAIPLEYIGTAEMMRLLQPIAGSSVQLQPIPNRNILLISGTRDEINSAIDAVNLFDIDVLEGKSIGLFRLKAAEPEAIVEELNLIFETSEGGSLQNVVTFLPSKRLGSVIVVTTRSKYLEKAERWIRDLDRSAGGNQRRPVVYSIQNRSAVELAPILAEMLREVSAEENVNIQGSARVVADDTKNAIVVWGNDTEQERFARLIQSLDTTPIQVMLEVTIAEISLKDELQFGLRWFFENGNLQGTFSDAAGGAIASTFPGLSFLFQGPNSAVALNALSSITDVNVISSPNITVLDNKEALLQIGDEVPIATQQVQDTANPNAPVVNTISFRDTGIILRVKPRVSSSGRVVLDIEQEVSSVSATTTSGIDSPTISQRKIQTSVVVSSGETIVLGGLIEESKNQTNGKVPVAGDIPVLGALFRNRKDVTRKTELIILISPRVVRNGAEARSITDELRGRLSGVNGLIKSGIGPVSDAHRIID